MGREKQFLWAGGGVVLALGLAVRLWAIGAEPLWLDEAYSAYAADHGFFFLWHVVPRYETHPPFYYSLVRLWTLPFGTSLIALRALGVVAGLATLPVIALAAREGARLLRWDGPRTRGMVFAAFAFACLAIQLVEMTRQVRPYPLLILVYAGATALLLRLARTRAIAGRGFALYLVLLELMLWLHNMGPLYGVALTLALGCAVLRPGIGRRDLIWLVGGHALVALCYLPCLAILLDQAPTWVRTTWLEFSFASLGEHLPMLYAAPGWPCLAALGLVVLAVAGSWRLAEGARTIAILLVLALVPLILSVSISILIAPVFITRTLSPAAVPALLVYAIGVAAWRGWPRWIGIAAALALGANMLAVDIQARQAGAMQRWYGPVAFLARHFRPGDLIWAYPNEGALPLAYALRDRHLDFAMRAIPGPVPAFNERGGYYVTGSRGVVSLPPWRVRELVDAPATRAVPTLWLLRLGPDTYDPDEEFLDAASAGRHAVARFSDDPIELVGLRRDDLRSPPAPVRNPR